MRQLLVGISALTVLAGLSIASDGWASESAAPVPAPSLCESQLAIVGRLVEIVNQGRLRAEVDLAGLREQQARASRQVMPDEPKTPPVQPVEPNKP